MHKVVFGQFMKAEEPITEYFKLDLNGTYTYWDYLKWHFKERVELIRGKVFKMTPPAPNRSHQDISRNLTEIFLKNFKGQKCRFYYAPFDVRLPVPQTNKDTTVVQPDLCVVCDENKLDTHGCNGAPDLVLEILSPGNSTHEMATKFKLYEESGVKEYWIVDPERKSVLVYTSKEAVFVGLHPFTEGMQIQSPLFPSLSADVDEIFKNITPESV